MIRVFLQRTKQPGPDDPPWEADVPFRSLVEHKAVDLSDLDGDPRHLTNLEHLLDDGWYCIGMEVVKT